MADNRMFLIHKASKLGIMLGKRMGWGWYNPPKQEELTRFYEYLRDYPEQDGFVLAMEDNDQSGCFGDWDYTDEKEDGFMVFKFKNKE